MAYYFFLLIAVEIDYLLQLIAAPTIRVQDIAAASSLKVPENRLEDIKAILKHIKALLYDSGRQIRKDAIKLWLKELQDLVIEVEDSVDDYQYYKVFQRKADMRRHPKIKRENVRADKYSEFEIPFDTFVRFVGIKSTFDDLLAQRQKAQKCSSHLLLISQEKQSSEKLQRVAEFLLAESLKSVKDLSYFPEDSIRTSKQYNAYDVTKQIYGRNSDMEFIISWLLGTNSKFSLFEDERSRNKFSAISIIGMAGVGKTTLTKEVYNDPLICKYFNSRVWLHFTEESDAVSLSKAFFVSITGKSCDGKEPVHLQSVMKEELKGKKLLLMLDDPQDLNPRLWEYLQAPLAGVRMAKFIITSRTELEDSKSRGIESYPLGCLHLDLSWDLFQHYAFHKDSSRPPELIEIGKYIVQKCRGLPIAVKTLGSLLGYQMDKWIWTDVLESELWELQETEADISPALQLSYYLLPTYLKPCFLYCSLFPRGYKFDKYELVRLWMAQGYIQDEYEDEDDQSLEIGCNYFHELQMLSIFDRSWDGTFTIHNLLYDVSKYMSNGECSSLSDGKMYTDSGKIRQLYVTSSKRTNELHSSNENLTLQLLYKSLGGVLPNDILTMALIKSMQGIRALELTHHGDSSIAETIQEKALDKLNASSVSKLRFIHLRYLRICDRFIEVLPVAVCQLYNLQTLTLDKCLKLRELPSDICMLVNLRYLGLSEANIEMLPESVCQLRNLQSLIVDYCKNLKELPRDIGNLGNLCHLGLCGTSVQRLPESVHRLSKLPTLKLDHCKILMELPSSLGNLVNLQHVMACKTKITKLPESICSLFNLLTLDLAYSNLSELPNDIGYLFNLNYLVLSYTNISILPESLCRLSSLRTLKLNGCTNLSQLPSGIGALKTLSHLVVSGIDIEQLPASVYQLFNLEVLEMDGCRRFFSLPDGIGYLTKLRQLKLSDTEIQELPESIGQLSNLQNLELNGCQRLSKLPENIGDLSELSNLEVTETKIKALPASFCQLSNLKVLNLNGNLDLQELPSGIENLANLSQLELSEVGIEVLPRCIVRLTNLEKLTFEHKQKPFDNYQL